MNTVEAEKRDLLFRQYEEQDRQARAEVVRLERREIELKKENIRAEKEELLRIENAKLAILASRGQFLHPPFSITSVCNLFRRSHTLS